MQGNVWAENDDINAMVVGEPQFKSALIEDPISSGVIDPKSNVVCNPADKCRSIDPK